MQALMRPYLLKGLRIYSSVIMYLSILYKIFGSIPISPSQTDSLLSTIGSSIVQKIISLNRGLLLWFQHTGSQGRKIVNTFCVYVCGYKYVTAYWWCSEHNIVLVLSSQYLGPRDLTWMVPLFTKPFCLCCTHLLKFPAVCCWWGTLGSFYTYVFFFIFQHELGWLVCLCLLGPQFFH